MSRKEEILQVAIKEFPRFAERRIGFISGAEWADKTMIEKACNWINEHMYDKEYEIKDDEGTWIDTDSLIEDFRKAMEE